MDLITDGILIEVVTVTVALVSNGSFPELEGKTTSSFLSDNTNFLEAVEYDYRDASSFPILTPNVADATDQLIYQAFGTIRIGNNNLYPGEVDLSIDSLPSPSYGTFLYFSTSNSSSYNNIDRFPCFSGLEMFF